MTVLLWITVALLVLAMGGIGGMKLVGSKTGIEQAQRLGYDNIRIPIGIAEVLAAVAIVLGAAVTDLELLGIAAAVGVIVMMIGALGYHLRAGDRFENIPAIVVIVAAALYMVALNAS
ncbi:MAG: DoxX family protein [Actinomycetota bacterium]